MKCLFVGGSQDGGLKDVDPLRMLTIRIPYPCAADDVDLNGPMFSYEEYFRVIKRTIEGDQTFEYHLLKST
jgi:hypothetical protein